MKYRCSICGFSNDPNYYAMRKIGKRWYHLICIDKVITFVLSRFDVKIDAEHGFRITEFKERKE